MSGSHDSDLPDDLADVAESVRRYGPQTTPPQLDAIKRRALTRASRAGSRKGPRMKSKLVVLALVSGLALSGGAAGVIAAGGGPDQSAAKAQYCNKQGKPKGCIPEPNP